MRTALLSLIAVVTGLAFAQNPGSAPVNSPAFRQTASVTVVNSTVETSVVSTGVGSMTLPTGYLQTGYTLQIRAMGFHSATANPTIQWKVKLGGVTILDSTAVSSQTSTNQALNILATITCRTAGAMGTVIGQGVYTETGNASASVGMVNTAAVTVDTTQALAVDVTVQWGTQSNSDTVTITNVVLGVL
jgi:hypothetical protein